MRYIPYSEDYLAHHGILGMKWGVRRYQNKDGSLTEAGRERYLHGTDYTIPKTSKYYRVSLNPNGYNEERGRVFVSTNTADNEKWKQLFKDGYTGRKLYDVQMASVKDIKVAGENTLKREWLTKMLSDNEFRDVVESDLDYAARRYGLRTYEDDGSYDYSSFSKILGYNTPSGKAFMTFMHDHGYDALADVYGKTNNVEEPLIILDPKESIRKIKINEV